MSKLLIRLMSHQVAVKRRVVIQGLIALILAVLAAALASPAHAQTAPAETPAAQAKRWFDMMKSTGSAQHDRCDNSPKRAQCDADYVSLYKVALTAFGAEALHDEAARRKDFHAAKFLYPLYDAAFKEMKRLDLELKEQYPITKAPVATGQGTDQRTLQPKVYKSKDF